LTGFRKPVSHYRNIVWNRGEKLYTSILEPTPDGRPYSVEGWGIAPAWASWTWPGYEGKNLQVEVDSRYDSVRLSLNGTLLGEKPTTEKEQFKAVFNVPYAAGELKTEGIQDGKVVDQNVLKTVGPAAAIRLTLDRKAISADGEDVSFITVESLDKDRNFQPNGDQQITFALTGPGIIAGVGSGDVTDEQPYQGSTRKLFHGRAQLVVRSGHDKGTVVVKATASGLTDGSTEIEIK
jgi:beta-galactosidase